MLIFLEIYFNANIFGSLLFSVQFIVQLIIRHVYLFIIDTQTGQ